MLGVLRLADICSSACSDARKPHLLALLHVHDQHVPK